MFNANIKVLCSRPLKTGTDYKQTKTFLSVSESPSNLLVIGSSAQPDGHVMQYSRPSGHLISARHPKTTPKHCRAGVSAKHTIHTENISHEHLNYPLNFPTAEDGTGPNSYVASVLQKSQCKLTHIIRLYNRHRRPKRTVLIRISTMISAPVSWKTNTFRLADGTCWNGIQLAANRV